MTDEELPIAAKNEEKALVATGTVDLQLGDELVRRKALPQKWKCTLCEATFYWDKNHEDEVATCPDCAAEAKEVQTE